MSVGDDYRLRRTDRRSAWEHAARDLGLDSGRLVTRVIDLAGRLPDAVALAAETCKVEGLRSHLPRSLVDLIANRCRRCVAVLS